MAYRKAVTNIKRENLIVKLVKVLIEWNEEEEEQEAGSC